VTLHSIRRFDVYVHRVLDRIQARFTVPFEALLTKGIARVNGGQDIS
jgi:hypothetical protein